jgi:putative transposase
MTRVTLAYRFELDLNNRQSTLAARHADLARYAFNWALATRNEHYRNVVLPARKRGEKIRPLSYYDLSKAWTAQKPRWAYSLSAWAALSAIEDLDTAFKKFFRARKEGRRVGFPRFKARGRCRESFRLRGSIHVEKHRVKLPVFGWLRIKGSASRFHADKILYATVSRDAGRWFVSITVEQERPEPITPTGEPVGLDLGIAHFLTLSDGTIIDAPQPLRAALRKLRRQQKAVARSQRNSNSRKRKVQKVARTHARVKAIRRDFLHRTSHQIATTYVAIGVERLDIKNLMRNRRLSRAISDMGWGEFLRQLAYKTQWYGSTLVVADLFFPSTKTCSGCGVVVDLPLSQRTYACAACGLVLDRDLNAARNLRPMAVTPTDINADGGVVRPGSAWQIPVKSEPSTAGRLAA